MEYSNIRCNIQFEELVEAYFDCRKNKRTTYGQLEFEIELETNLIQLHKELINGTYSIGQSTCFVVTYPKAREVWAAQFKDRIIHHILYNRYGHRFNRIFIDDTFACIPNRGTTHGIERLETHVRRATHNWTKKKYYLKCDFSNFFTSINKNVLWSLQEPRLRRFEQEEWVIQLARYVLFNECTKDPILKSTEYEHSLVPDRKSLFKTEKDVGLPIGNLTSQLDANIILNEVDQYAKHDLKIKHYMRYVDDIVIIGDSPKELFELFRAIETFADALGLYFNPTKTHCHPVDRGITFIGQTVYPYRRVPSHMTVKRIINKVNHGSHIEDFLHYFKQAPQHHNLVERLSTKYCSIGA